MTTTNPLLNVPLNTKKVYVMASTKTGCDVYMPVDSFTLKLQTDKRDELQKWLDTQS